MGWIHFLFSVYFVTFRFVLGQTDFVSNCRGQFKKEALTPFASCIGGNLTVTETIDSPKTCASGEYLFIEDFNVNIVKSEVKNCEELGGFKYSETVTASCLQSNYKDLSKKIALVFIKAYSWTQYENASRNQVESDLKKIVPVVSLIDVKFSCSPSTSNFIDICKSSAVNSWNKGYIKLDSTSSYKDQNTIFTSCTCSITSSGKNISVQAVDIRLNSKDSLQSFEEISLSGSDIFQDTKQLLWKLDEKKLFSSNFVNITLSLGEKRFPESFWLEVDGSNMSISCDPVFRNESEDYTVTSQPQSSGLSQEIIIGIAVGGFLAVVIIVILVCVICKRRKNRPRDHHVPSRSVSKDEAIYSEPGTPATDSSKNPMLSQSEYFELQNDHDYAEPAPRPNNNSKIDNFGHRAYLLKDKGEDFIQNNIYNHLGENEAVKHGNIYDTTGREDYTTIERNKNRKVIDNVYDK